MRKLRVTLIILFILSAALFAGTIVKDRFFTDKTAPVITADSDSITLDASLSQEEQEAQMLAGLSATDDQDGELTSDIRLSTLSRLDSNGNRTATFIVFDSSDNAATYTRTISYTNYHMPEIHGSSLFRVEYDSLEDYNFTENLTATDLLDGDITSRISIELSTYTYQMYEGEYEATLRVSNSSGDSTSIPITITVYSKSDDDAKNAVYPLLSDNFVYTGVGMEVNPYDYIIGYNINGTDYSNETDPDYADVIISGVSVSSNVDYTTPGVYTIDYTYTSSDGITSTTHQYVIVEENYVPVTEEASEDGEGAAEDEIVTEDADGSEEE